MRIKQRNALAVGKVLGDEVEQQRAFSGSSLPDNVEMPAAFVGAEHDEITRGLGADAKPLVVRRHSRNGNDGQRTTGRATGRTARGEHNSSALQINATTFSVDAAFGWHERTPRHMIPLHFGHDP